MATEAVMRDHNLVEIPTEVLQKFDLPIGSTLDLSESNGSIILGPFTKLAKEPLISMEDLRAYLKTLPSMNGLEEELYEERKTW